MGEQADQYADEYILQHGIGMKEWDVIRDRKFAEMVVQECISTIALIGIANWENEDIAWAATLAVHQIREHHGMLRAEDN